MVNVPFDKDKIIFFEKNITEEQSINLERKLIKFYGRKGIDVGGCLINKTKGGNGGFSGKMSEETKKKIGNAVKRNKIKRRLRNIRNDLIKKISINLGYSYLVIAKPTMLNTEFKDIKEKLFQEFKKIK